MYEPRRGAKTVVGIPIPCIIPVQAGLTIVAIPVAVAQVLGNLNNNICPNF